MGKDRTSSTRYGHHEPLTVMFRNSSFAKIYVIKLYEAIWFCAVQCSTEGTRDGSTPVVEKR